jgi:hypothetical protein
MQYLGPVKAVQLAWGRTDVGHTQFLVDICNNHFNAAGKEACLQRTDERARDMATTSTTSIALQLHDDLYVQQRRSVPGSTPRVEQKLV